MENKTKSTNLHISSYAATATTAAETPGPSNPKWCIINKMFMGKDINRKTIYSLSNKSRSFSYASDATTNTHTYTHGLKNVMYLHEIQHRNKCARTQWSIEMQTHTHTQTHAYIFLFMCV